jgi:aspartyl-tRNA(Asn)/glutamyl-tRNA(Gln) amidotransferase subunit A
MVNLKRPIHELVSQVASGTVKAADLVQHASNQIEKHKDLNAVLEVNPAAIDLARAVDSSPKKGRLAGVPFIAKDNFLTLNTHTTAASNILKPFRAPYQATAIQKLEAEGAILVAKANLDAFAHGASTENSDFGPTRNPWDVSRVPGGSSGGSAAAVAAGLCSFALGTDTGGSIRQPAGFCGVVGLKPTYGLISRYGVIAMASSFDVVGPLANSIESAALVLDVLAGRDGLDATAIDRDPDSYEVTSSASRLKGLKVGLIKEYLGYGVDQGVKDRINGSVEHFKASGASVDDVSLPSVRLALACYYILVPAEVSSNLARYDGIKYGHSAIEAQGLSDVYGLTRDQGFGTEAKRRILTGTFVLSSGYYDAYYKQAQKVRSMLIHEFENAFEQFDILVGPTSPTTAFGLGQKANDPLAMYMSDIMTVAANITGNPAITLPVGLDYGLPVGIQLIGPQKGERKLLEVASTLESLVGHIGEPPR